MIQYSKFKKAYLSLDEYGLLPQYRVIEYVYMYMILTC